MMQPQRAFAASCSIGVINRTSSPVFYIDTGITPSVVGNYVSYTITNTSGSAYADLWVKLEGFSGSRITLAAGETGIAHVGSLANGASKTVFFYLANTAGTGDTLTAQSHTVSLYSTRPDLASGSICGDPFSQTVEETLKALANKVTAVVAGPNPPELGGIMTITVTGDTGTIANAGIFAPTPASFANWPANAYKLVGTQITLTRGNTGTFNNILYKSGLNSQDTSYTIVYTFVAAGATTGPTSVTPVTQINSGGTNIKHNDTSGASLLAIQPTTNKVTLTKSVSSPALALGGIVTYTVTLNNTGAVATTLDDIIDILPSSPSNAIYVIGSAQFNNSRIPDPNISGQTLTFLGLFTVPAGGTRTLTYQATIPNTIGTYTNRAIGHIGSTQIDTTLTTADNMPATANVSVGPLPVTVSGTVFNDTDRSKVQNGSEVLVNMTGLNAVLVNTTTGLVVAQTTVTSGAFSFSNVTANTNYTVQITTATATVGSVPPAITLPNFVSTGENLDGNIDGTVDSKLSVAVTTSNVTGVNFGIKQAQTINNTPSPTSCSVLGGTLFGNNLFTPLDNGTFGVENGSPNQSPAINPYLGVVSGGNYRQFYSSAFTYGDYSYVANPVTPRNSFQHPGITDPVYGATGRFFASDPNTSTPTLTTTLTGLTPNQFYEYSFWAANSEPNGNPNNVDVLINGQKIYTTGPLLAIATALEWKKYTVSFTNGSSTSITIDLKSTETGSAGNDFYLDNIELRGCNFIVDYGDAPPSYGDAIHTTIPTTPKVYLGTVAPDGETSTPLGGDNGAGADGDDANQGINDEDAFTSLPIIPTTGTYTLNNIPVKNTSGGDVTLHAWIDFNRDGKFAVGEYQSTTVANNATTANLSWTVPSGAISGKTYARFRITPNALITDNVNTTDVDERSKDAVIDGEVEDYQVSIGNSADVLLLKRITAINGLSTNPNDNTTSLTGVLVDPTSSWKPGYVVGATNGGPVKPGDTIEYTIYYLNNGGRNAKSVRICDRLNANQTFYPDTYPNSTFIQNNTTNPNPIGSGMQVQKGISAALTLTNTSDSDGGQFVAATGTALPTNCNSVAGAPNNDYGALILDLVTSPGSPNLTALPGKTGQGSPNDSFGLWRFITKVNKVSP